jgi:hypothetical protein
MQVLARHREHSKFKEVQPRASKRHLTNTHVAKGMSATVYFIAKNKANIFVRGSQVGYCRTGIVTVVA